MSEATVDVADLRSSGAGSSDERADDEPLREDIRLLGRVLGEAGQHARSAVGVAVLPLDSPVEVELIAEFS